MREVVIASSVRTAVGKAPRGALRNTRPDDMAAVAIKGAFERLPPLGAKEVEDVIIRCAPPPAQHGMDAAPLAGLPAGAPPGASALTPKRLCSPGGAAHP